MKKYASEVYDVLYIQNILNIVREKAYQLVNSGTFHTIKVDTRIKIPKVTFHQWLNGQSTLLSTLDATE